jgi:hypothetical protein
MKPSDKTALVEELAKVFHDQGSADHLLDKIDFPRPHRRPFEGLTSLVYWNETCREIELGRTLGELEALQSAAASIYPHNSVFGKPEKESMIAVTGRVEMTRQTCVDCHFFVKSYRDTRPPHTFVVNEQEREATRRCDLSWHDENEAPVALACHRGIWDQGVAGFPHKNRFELLLEQERHGACFFWEHHPGMLLDAAMELQGRAADAKENKAERRMEPRASSSSTWNKIAAFTFGLLFNFILLAIALFLPDPTEFQTFIFRVTLALAASGIGAVVPGFLDVNLQRGEMFLVRSGGAIALFLIIYLFNPPALIHGGG